MSESIFKQLMCTIALLFTLFVMVYLIPPLIASEDILGSLALGFVNIFSTAYTLDAIFCWIVLTIWVFYESKAFLVKHGWICVILGIFPGVAVGFPIYLLLRHSQLKQSLNQDVS